MLSRPRSSSSRKPRSASAATFLDWWWPEAFGAEPGEAVAAGFHAAMHAMLAPVASRGFVHRDYFPANLMPLDRPGPRAVGILDFQDAALGHPAYDLVSLVEDARRDVDAALWVRLARRDGKWHYLRHGPRCPRRAGPRAGALRAARA